MDDELLDLINRFASLSDLRLILPHWNRVCTLLKKENIVQATFYILETVHPKLRRLYASLAKNYFDEMNFEGLDKFQEFLINAVGDTPSIVVKKKRKKPFVGEEKTELNKLQTQAPTQKMPTFFEAPWESIGFADGFITIKHNNHFYKKYLEKSKKYLNEIKHFYSFHNIPKLEIELVGSSIRSIKNEEVLFYHIDFLTITASHFGFINSESFNLRNWKKYTKQYYKSKLPFLFHKQALNSLCEYCDPNSPIIPVGEVVKNQAGRIVIHNSFLFPMSTKYGNFIVWESIQEHKASYIFSVRSLTNQTVRPIFNYIAGDTQNKRLTLIRSALLQSKIGLTKRIAHTDFSLWDFEIRNVCGF